VPVLHLRQELSNLKLQRPASPKWISLFYSDEWTSRLGVMAGGILPHPPNVSTVPSPCPWISCRHSMETRVSRAEDRGSNHTQPDKATTHLTKHQRHETPRHNASPSCHGNSLPSFTSSWPSHRQRSRHDEYVIKPAWLHSPRQSWTPSMTTASFIDTSLHSCRYARYYCMEILIIR
jgi:hypothetical protein